MLKEKQGKTQTKTEFTYTQAEFPTLNKQQNQETTPSAWGPRQADSSPLSGFAEIGKLAKEANIGHLLENVKRILTICINATSDAEKTMIILTEVTKLN